MIQAAADNGIGACFHRLLMTGGGCAWGGRGCWRALGCLAFCTGDADCCSCVPRQPRATQPPIWLRESRGAGRRASATLEKKPEARLVAHDELGSGM